MSNKKLSHPFSISKRNTEIPGPKNHRKVDVLIASSWALFVPLNSIGGLDSQIDKPANQIDRLDTKKAIQKVDKRCGRLNTHRRQPDAQDRQPSRWYTNGQRHVNSTLFGQPDKPDNRQIVNTARHTLNRQTNLINIHSDHRHIYRNQMSNSAVQCMEVYSLSSPLQISQGMTNM